MTLSIWRYSHLGLAFTFSVFILLAAITGTILAFDPINEQLNSNVLSFEAKNQSVSKTISVLKNEYLDVISLDINSHNQAIAEVVTYKGKNKRVFINPINGISLGSPKEKHAVFNWATSLHRSLFFKKTGRFLVGLTSFVLCVISLTGIILICKRQGGIKAFFSNIVKDNSLQYFHIILGRWTLIPILVLTLTGVFLSLEKFSVIPQSPIQHAINFEKLSTSIEKDVSDFEIFKHIKLHQINKIEFPFSDDIEDYYILYLTNKEIVVNQITGEVISEQNYPFTRLVSYYSLVFHTGHGSILWTIVLLLSCIGILYFLYSGFVMTLTRKKGKIKNSIRKNDAEIVILVGSEGGTTLNYANALHQQLLKQNLKSYLTELNQFEAFDAMKKLIVFTATYGDGDAPTNAKKFIKKLNETPLLNHIDFSIIGFGSRAYQHFCQFAFNIQEQLNHLPQTTEVIELTTINNNSFEAFTKWIDKLSSFLNIEINIQKKELGFKKLQTQSFNINKITTLNEQVDDTFLLELTPPKKTNFTSGDLLAIYPENDDKERLYSIAKTTENNILISVRKHNKGVVSNYLHQQIINSEIKATIIKNTGFHYPKKATEVILIATGTGIAPFLGMISNNTQNKPTHLFWGGRNKNSFNLYETIIKKALNKKQLNSFYPAYSRNDLTKTYVQDIIYTKKDFIYNSLNNKATIMICGSVPMQKEVIKILEQICLEKNNKQLSYFKNNGQLLMDCY
ncbi:MAG: PepSY domain-containing protein [Flavobacteriaceae bacterium]|nr:PepSY domain-containing protein [Flavobacteriaceae bacterium]